MHVEYTKFVTKRKFGVELEVEQNLTRDEIYEILTQFESQSPSPREIIVQCGSKAWAESNSNDYWHVKYDSTCGPKGYKKDDGGWEIASFVGSGVKDLLHIAAGAERLGDRALITNDNCGLHVHVDASDFSANEMGILLAYWLKVEPFILQACPIHRSNNKYCMSLRKKVRGHKLTCPYELWQLIKPINLGPHENLDKKVTLNTVGFAKFVQLGISTRATVELRVPECLLEKDHVVNWVRLIVNFVEQCKGRPMPNTLSAVRDVNSALEVLGLQKPRGSFSILSRGLHNTKLWFLERLVAFSTSEKVRKDSLDKLDFITNLGK